MSKPETLQRLKMSQSILTVESYKVNKMFCLAKRLRQSGSSGGEAAQFVAVLDRDNFEDRIEEAGLAFVMFHTDWCRHCKPLASTWEMLASQYRTEDVTVASVDCNAADNVNKELCANLGVSGVPAIQIFHGGVKVSFCVLGGLQELSRLRTTLAAELSKT